MVIGDRSLGCGDGNKNSKTTGFEFPQTLKAEELENRVELVFCHSQHWGVQPAAGSCVLLDHLSCGFVLIFVLFFSLFYYERGHYYKKERNKE